MKAELDELFNKLEIRNIDLNIDKHVDEMCKITNHTSSLTRRSLYFSIIVSIFSIVIVLNTRHFSWTDARMADVDSLLKKDYEVVINDAQRSISEVFVDSNYNQTTILLKTILDSLGNVNNNISNKQKSDYYKQEIVDIINHNENNRKLYANYLADILRIKYDKSIIKEDALLKKKIDTIIYPTLPVLGTTFDVNDFGIVLGFIFVFLLLIELYGSNREIINTKIAFKAVTDRYKTDDIHTDYLHEIRIIEAIEKKELDKKNAKGIDSDKIQSNNENKSSEPEYYNKEKNPLISIWVLNKYIIKPTKKNLMEMSEKIIGEIEVEGDDLHNTHLKGKLDARKDISELIIEKILNEIDRKYNETRRKYHYNFLTMNEIFNVPKISMSNGLLNIRISRFVVFLLHMIPFVIFSLVIYNDYSTISKGKDLSTDLTIGTMLFEGAFLITILILCLTLSYSQYKLNDLYDKFFYKNYTFNGKEE